MSDPSPASVPMEADAVMPILPPELVYDLIMSWRGTKYEVKVPQLDTIGDLKSLLWTLTSVPPERMKLLGLVKGKLPGDEQEMGSLGLGGAGGDKGFMMVGTPEGAEIGPPPPGDPNEDVDIDYSAVQLATKTAAQSVRNLRKLKEAADGLSIDIMSPPRFGKKLLVLDLDYCILDTGLWKEANFVADHFARPYLHDFLAAVSPHYDICIWSQTSWRWLETKLVELRIIGDDKMGDYPIVCVLDRTPMFSVYSEREGKPFKHEVKALGILWSKFPGFYSHLNTVHVDDLARNFKMNVGNGIRVHAYKNAMENSATDIELLYVAKYLLHLSLVRDVTTFDHSKFRKAKGPLPEGSEDPLNKIRRTGPSSSHPPPS